jgi:hypothetical protein
LKIYIQRIWLLEQTIFFKKNPFEVSGEKLYRREGKKK